MLFNSTIFILVFLPLTLLAYYLAADSRRVRLAVLCLASIVFYAYWDVRFVPLLLVSATANWLLVQAFAMRRVSILPAAGVVLNLAVLGTFKCADFFAGSFDLFESALDLFASCRKRVENWFPGIRP